MISWLFGNKKALHDEIKKADDNFVSLSSHQLRSPLSIIKWYTEILLDEDAGPLTDDQKKYLTVIESSNQRAIDLVRSLLNVSRLDLGTFRIVPEPVSLVDIIGEAVSSLEKETHAKKITIIHSHGDDIPTFNADKHICLLR